MMGFVCFIPLDNLTQLDVLLLRASHENMILL